MRSWIRFILLLVMVAILAEAAVHYAVIGSLQAIANRAPNLWTAAGLFVVWALMEGR